MNSMENLGRQDKLNVGFVSAVVCVFLSGIMIVKAQTFTRVLLYFVVGLCCAGLVYMILKIKSEVRT